MQMSSSNVVAIDSQNFQQVIVEASQEKLVLVAFWAEQVPESVAMLNQLVQVAEKQSDDFILATVDVAKEQMVAGQFGVRGLPTAVFVKAAQAVDMIEGPQPEEAVTEFLARHLPNEADKLLANVKTLLEQDNAKEAFPLCQQAYQLAPERADIQLALTDIYLQTGKVTEAETLLATIKMADQDSYYKALMAKLELAQTAAESPEIAALEASLASDPEDIEVVRNLAAQYSQVNKHQEALELLFTYVKKDLGDGETKGLFLDLMKALPDGDPLTAQYRRKLYTLMY